MLGRVWVRGSKLHLTSVKYEGLLFIISALCGTRSTRSHSILTQTKTFGTGNAPLLTFPVNYCHTTHSLAYRSRYPWNVPVSSCRQTCQCWVDYTCEVRAPGKYIVVLHKQFCAKIFDETESDTRGCCPGKACARMNAILLLDTGYKRSRHPWTVSTHLDRSHVVKARCYGIQMVQANKMEVEIREWSKLRIETHLTDKRGLL